MLFTWVYICCTTRNSCTTDKCTCFICDLCWIKQYSHIYTNVPFESCNVREWKTLEMDVVVPHILKKMDGWIWISVTMYKNMPNSVMYKKRRITKQNFLLQCPMLMSWQENVYDGN